jgi:hypothetical protein
MACMIQRTFRSLYFQQARLGKREKDVIGALDTCSSTIRRLADLALVLHWLVHLTTRNWLRKEGLITQWTERAMAA